MATTMVWTRTLFVLASAALQVAASSPATTVPSTTRFATTSASSPIDAKTIDRNLRSPNPPVVAAALRLLRSAPPRQAIDQLRRSSMKTLLDSRRFAEIQELSEFLILRQP